MLALCFVIALSLFFAGMAKTLHRDTVRRLVAGIAGLGVIVALVGLAEARTSWPGVYAMAGLPTPPDSPPFGPFSSRNHYAGWMLMAVAITSAYLGALFDRVGRSSAHDSETTNTAGIVLLQCAVTVMALALVQTQSRAGILGLGLIVLMIVTRLMRRQTDVRSRVILAAPFLVLPVVGILVAGSPAIVNRFTAHSWTTAHGRLPIWEQGITMARDFPITGAGLNTYQRIAKLYPSSGFDQPYEGAHNDFLQLAIEGGLLVGIPAVILIGFFISETRRRFRESAGDSVTEWIRIGAVVGLVAIAAQELVEFTLQIPGNAALFVVLAAIAIHRSPPAVETHPRPRWR
jgi:O-antigen ligase